MPEAWSASLPRLRTAAAITGTMALGAASGWLFSVLGVPLPWMLGAMTVTAIAALAGAPVRAPTLVRPVVLPVLGVLLGSSFSPQVFSNLGSYVVTMVAMIALVAISGAATVLYYRRIVGLDPVTSYFAGMPGGVMDMAIMGEEAGGDPRAIALAHAARIAIIVATVPFIVQFAEHVTLGPRVASSVSFAEAPLQTYVWMIATAAAGVVMGKLLHLPARYMLGPLVLSAVVHGAGFSDFVVPREVVNAAQVVLGTVTGCRFAGFARRQIVTIVGHSLIVNSLMIGVTCVVAWLLAPYSPGGFSSILLAFAAGGLSEMCLVALALRLDITFVIVHQLTRIALVIGSAPLVFRLIGKKPDQPPKRG